MHTSRISPLKMCDLSFLCANYMLRVPNHTIPVSLHTELLWSVE